MLRYSFDHGVDVRGDPWGWEFDEEVLAHGPARLRCTFAIDGDVIEVTAAKDLTVLAVSRR